MLLEDCDRSTAPVKLAEPHFSAFSEFRGASYRDRYSILIEKLVRERLYDGAAFLLSSQIDAESGRYRELNLELTFAKLATSLLAHVSKIRV